MTGVVVRSAGEEDAAAIVAIYNFYIANTVVTFEEEAVSTEAMAVRIANNRGPGLPWLVAELDHAIVGYAYARPWKERSAYRYAVETTIYLKPGCEGRGIGKTLYSTLLPLLRAAGVHVVIGGVALPNAASIALHEKLGFEKVAHFREVGFKHDRWVDVAYWQITLH
jgi:L-amino acid N-acyltransferase YncA